VAHATRGHDRAAIGQVLIYPTPGAMSTGLLCRASGGADAELRTFVYRDMQARQASPDDPRLAPFARHGSFGAAPRRLTAQSIRFPRREDYRDRIVAAGAGLVDEEAGSSTATCVPAQRTARGASSRDRRPHRRLDVVRLKSAAARKRQNAQTGVFITKSC